MKYVPVLLVMTLIQFLVGCSSQPNLSDTSKTTSGESVKETNVESDPSENILEAEVQENPACTDECSTNSCDGYKFISCETMYNSCKSEVNKGHVKGKCNVNCIAISDCKNNEQCSGDFNCIEKETIYSMNQDIDVDYITYKITKAESFTEMGTSMFDKETEGKFIKVYLKLTNNAQETKQIFTPRFKIEDSKGRKYDRLSDNMMYISDYLEFGKQLQPGLTTSGAIVFELPTDSTDLKLIISGDWVSVSQVKITLDSIQNIGKDTTQQDEQDEMVDELMEDAQKQTEELLNQCNSPFTCTSSCPDYMDVGQKNCPSGQLCCMQS